MSLADPLFPIPNPCDLHHALSVSSCSSPNTPIRLTSFIASLFENGSDLMNLENVFPLHFSRRVEWLNSLIQSEWVPSSFVVSQISKCLSEFDKFRTKYTINLKIAQAIYSLAQELKRHESNRKTIWSALPQPYQTLLHRLSPWSEDLDLLSGPLSYQWLADGNLARARQNMECLTDFGGGRLFRVLPPVLLEEQKVFPLVQNRHFHLVKTSLPPRHSLSSLSCLLRAERRGRIHEVFDVQLLDRQVIEGGEEAGLYLNQLQTLFACYRSALCETLGLSVSLPQAIGRLGEWTIWSNDKKAFKEGSPLTEKQLKDLHRFFALEKLLNITLLGDSKGRNKSHWAVCEGSLVQEGVLPLPTFLKEDIEKRHEDFLSSFKLDDASRRKWERLEEEVKGERDRMEHQLEGLQKLVVLNKISSEDLINPSPQVLLMTRLLGHLHLKGSENLPSISDPVDIANRMLSVVMPPPTEGPWQNNEGTIITDTLLKLKEELKRSLLWDAIKIMELKGTGEEFILTNLERIKDRWGLSRDQLLKLPLSTLWKDSNKSPNEDEKLHLMLHCEGFLQELESFLKSPMADEEKLFGQMLCLKTAASLPHEDIQELNQSLHSCLHDAMIQRSSQKFLEEFQEMFHSPIRP
jgi:hypothetical protein